MPQSWYDSSGDHTGYLSGYSLSGTNLCCYGQCFDLFSGIITVLHSGIKLVSTTPRRVATTAACKLSYRGVVSCYYDSNLGFSIKYLVTY